MIKPIIGIPKWDWKKKVTHFAERHPNVKDIAIEGTCHECSRHLGLLKAFDSGFDVIKTEYYDYYKRQNRKHKSIIKRTEEFRKLYNAIKGEGCRVPPIVTDDGCRLNGSHRLAILLHIGYIMCKLNIVSYERIFNAKKSNKIREFVREYRKRVYGL